MKCRNLPIVFGRLFVKRFALCYRSVVCPVCPVCLFVCLSVCNVGVLWPNGWTDQDETWHAGTPWPWPHCVRWGPSSPSPKGAQPPSPIFGPYPLRPNGCMDQDVTWYAGRLSPGDFVLDGDPAPGSPSPQIFGPCLLRPNGWIDEAGTWHGGRPQPR